MRSAQSDRRHSQPTLESLETRMALSGAIRQSTILGLIPVSESASGPALRALAGSFRLGPVQTAASHTSGSVVVDTSDLRNPCVLRWLKRVYRDGGTVAVTRAGRRAATLLGNTIGSPELALPLEGSERADLVAFRKVEEGGREFSNVSVLMPRKRNTPLSNATTRAFLVGLFHEPLTIPKPSTPINEPGLDLMAIADAYQTSMLDQDKEGHAVQVVNTFYSARSFTNRRDLYFIEQEVAVQGTSTWPSLGARIGNAMLDPLDPPLTLKPSPQSNPQAKTITSEVSHTIGGSIGFTQGEGLNVSINASVTISNSETVTVPPVRITYTGDLPTGDTRWSYETTTNEGIRTSTFINQWLWQVPFENYAAGAKTVTIGTGVVNSYNGPHGPRGLSLYVESVVPTPFGDVYELGVPVVSGVSAATVKPGATFRIEGTALYPGQIEAVLIGGVELPRANYRPISDRVIEVVAPSATGKNQPIVVKTSQGLSNADVTITIQR